MKTPKEIADDILFRCWWRPEQHPGEERPPFAGLDKEIERAVGQAVAVEREACALAVEMAAVKFLPFEASKYKAIDAVALAIRARQ